MVKARVIITWQNSRDKSLKMKYYSVRQDNVSAHIHLPTLFRLSISMDLVLSCSLTTELPWIIFYYFILDRFIGSSLSFKVLSFILWISILKRLPFACLARCVMEILDRFILVIRIFIRRLVLARNIILLMF